MSINVQIFVSICLKPFQLPGFKKRPQRKLRRGQAQNRGSIFRVEKTGKGRERKRLQSERVDMQGRREFTECQM